MRILKHLFHQSRFPNLPGPGNHLYPSSWLCNSRFQNFVLWPCIHNSLSIASQRYTKFSNCKNKFLNSLLQNSQKGSVLHPANLCLYTTNWIERIQKDFKRVTLMHGAMPDKNSVIVLMGKSAMDKDSYQRVIPMIREDASLFPIGSASKGD